MMKIPKGWEQIHSMKDPEFGDFDKFKNKVAKDMYVLIIDNTFAGKTEFEVEHGSNYGGPSGDYQESFDNYKDAKKFAWKVMRKLPRGD